MRVVFVEPPKEFWFVMGEYLPPPTAAIQLAAYLEARRPGDEIAVIDCQAVRLLKESGIFAQATLIIGHRGDTHGLIEGLRRFVDDLDPDLAIFMILTPFPGTKLHDEAVRSGWIEDWNWANYDMIHAVMPTETLSREEVQQELYDCYRGFYGSLSRQLRGILSSNRFKRRTYRYLASQKLLRQLRDLI